MSKLGKKLIRGVKEALEVTVHPGDHAFRLPRDSVVLSVDAYERLKQAASFSDLSELSTEQFRDYTERRLKAACKVLKKGLPRYIKSSGAGVTFNDGYEDVVADALAVAAYERIVDDA